MKSFILIFFACGLVCLAREKESDEHTCPANVRQFAAIQKKATAGNADAQFTMASCYELGRNVKADRQENIHWLALAAKQGHPSAQHELGRIYLFGRGVPSDYAQALAWEEKAAQQGLAPAQRNVAYMYERGFGVPPDAAKAALWNRKAANQGDANAQLRLAQSLEPTDSSEAKKWYAEAAKQGQPQAQMWLASSYIKDGGKKAACPGGITWYRKAAEQGQAEAMYELGQLMQGRCGRNDLEAYEWFLLGGRFGLKQSQTEAEKLAGSLSSVQKQTAEAFASRWISKHSGAKKEEDEEEKRQ